MRRLTDLSLPVRQEAWASHCTELLASHSLSPHFLARDPVAAFALRPTKTVLRKRFEKKTIAKPITEVRERGREKVPDKRIKRERRHTSTNQGRLVPWQPGKARPANKQNKTLPAPHCLSYCSLRSRSPTIRDLNPVPPQPPILSHVLRQTDNSQVLSNHFF